MRWPFREWGAEVVLAGHDHTYERFAVDGIPYFVNGLGGASKYEFPTAPVPETRFRYNEEFGAMRVTATPAQIGYEFFTIDGKNGTFSPPLHPLAAPNRPGDKIQSQSARARHALVIGLISERRTGRREGGKIRGD